MARDGLATMPRVLLTMDGPLAKVIELVLNHGRYESRVATDRATFEALLGDWAPQVVLIDWDAYPEFLKLSQTTASPEVPTLVFTRRRETALKLRAFEEGADDVLLRRETLVAHEAQERLLALLLPKVQLVHAAASKTVPASSPDSRASIASISRAETIAARQPAWLATRHASTLGSIPPSIVPSSTSVFA